MHKFLAMAALAALISSPVIADDHAEAVDTAHEHAEEVATDAEAEAVDTTTEAAEETMKKEAPAAE